MEIIILFIFLSTSFTVNSYYIYEYIKPNIIHHERIKNNHNKLFRICNYYNNTNIITPFREFNPSSFKEIKSFKPVITLQYMLFYIAKSYSIKKDIINNHVEPIENTEIHNFNKDLKHKIKPYKKILLLFSTILMSLVFLLIYNSNSNLDCCVYV